MISHMSTRLIWPNSMVDTVGQMETPNPMRSPVAAHRGQPGRKPSDPTRRTVTAALRNRARNEPVMAMMAAPPNPASAIGMNTRAANGEYVNGRPSWRYPTS